MPSTPHAAHATESRLPGIVLGAGLGGFVDGIVLHQVVQWHAMGSAVLPPVTMDAMRRNMRWDGLFHAAMWLAVLAGVFLLARDARRGLAIPPPRRLAGQLVLGWGAFNVVEGVVDHHLLAIHHVRDQPVHVPAWDWAFLLVGGAGLVLLGWWLARVPRRPAMR